jgi:hypothetical protein
LSSGCITSRIALRRLQPTGDSDLQKAQGWRRTCASSSSGRVRRVPLPVSSVKKNFM